MRPFPNRLSAYRMGVMRNLESSLQETQNPQVAASLKLQLEAEKQRDIKWRLDFGATFDVTIDVPFGDRHEAYALGARRDAAKQRWFVPARKPLKSFLKWLPDSMKPSGPLETVSLAQQSEN